MFRKPRAKIHNGRREGQVGPKHTWHRLVSSGNQCRSSSCTKWCWPPEADPVILGWAEFFIPAVPGPYLDCEQGGFAVLRGAQVFREGDPQGRQPMGKAERHRHHMHLPLLSLLWRNWHPRCTKMDSDRAFSLHPSSHLDQGELQDSQPPSPPSPPTYACMSSNIVRAGWHQRLQARLLPLRRPCTSPSLAIGNPQQLTQPQCK